MHSCGVPNLILLQPIHRGVEVEVDMTAIGDENSAAYALLQLGELLEETVEDYPKTNKVRAFRVD